ASSRVVVVALSAFPTASDRILMPCPISAPTPTIRTFCKVHNIHAAAFSNGEDVSQFTICEDVPSFGKKDTNHTTRAIATASANPTAYIVALTKVSANSPIQIPPIKRVSVTPIAKFMFASQGKWQFAE